MKIPSSSSPPGVVREAAPADARPAPRPSSRETILTAAEAVVLADGAAHLTLDAVAERAGVSKGGLLYNFPTKEALLQAMIDRHMSRLDLDRAAALTRLPSGPGRELKACVLMAADNLHGHEKRLGCSMLAATANDPRLLEPVRRFHERKLALLEESAASGVPFERAAVVSLAVDGLCLLEMLQLSPFSADQRKRILAKLLQLVDEMSTGAPADAVLQTSLEPAPVG